MDMFGLGEEEFWSSNVNMIFALIALVVFKKFKFIYSYKY